MNYRHGQAGSPEYRVWKGMKERCTNPSCCVYHNYGGRGIKVCERWYDFRNFFADMGPRPNDLTLDRKNNNGNYEPGNCRWVTRKIQAGNTRNLSWFYGYGPNGEMIVENNQHEVARVFGLNQGCISACLRKIKQQTKDWRFQKIL